ncbi:MAG: hypothetical protein A3F68_06905 [Acidobacteria bacterium RIFCSPLOWO2_12_FULL_54_10]|nr:MAG: hypothetical protein A3F68_06905 [Acidobacteria bacterium RIFCSPLOWO2_12_FULL_54_10]
MHRVITIAREYASGGAVLAEQLAKRLNWRLLDKALIEEVARKMQVSASFAEQFDEKIDPWLHRLAKESFRFGAFEGVADWDETEMLDADRVVAISRRMIEEAAAIGNCIIVGRGGQCLLNKRTDTFHLFLYAPREARIRTIRERMLENEHPEALLDTMDHIRAAYISHYYGHNWQDRHLYHAMINAALGLPEVCAMVLSAVAVPITKE